MPTSWKKAVIIPIEKPKKPGDEMGSYRPISLTSIIAKTMERMVATRLQYYLECNKLISNDQADHHASSLKVDTKY